MLAYHSNPTIKKNLVNRLKDDFKQDRIIHGAYWENGKGCAVGCTIRGSSHAEYETQLGIPQSIARLEDTIFEGLTNGVAQKFPLNFANAIKPGADLSKVTAQFFVWCLLDKKHGAIRHTPINKFIDCHNAILAAAVIWQQYIKSGVIDKSAAESAARSARSAAESAARSAESAARSVRSARSAARSAAELAAWSAWSAESAARSARSVRSARSAESAAESAAWSAARSVRSAESAARSAELAAWSAWSAESAAESAAWSAARSARSARSAARSAAWSAARSARSARSAARSAESAARSAGTAKKEFWIAAAATLIKLLQKAPIIK